MTPGTYLRLWRERAGKSLDDIALATETAPPVCAQSRAEWLATIEADAAPISMGWALRLLDLLKFDWETFVALHAVAEGIAVHAPRVCGVCACSDYYSGARWAEEDRCLACASQERLVA